MRILVAILLAGCVGGLPGETEPRDDGGIAGDGGGSSGGDGGGGLDGGSLAVSWMHGQASCGQSTDPELQIHQYNATTYIIRQDKCRTFEAPFVYLLLGTDRALLLDSGGTQSAGLRSAVMPLVGARALVVAHSHAHGDHTAGDGTFSGQPNTTVVGTSPGAVGAMFGIASWPTSVGSIDLGGRALDVLAIPGHEQSHVAFYDRRTGLLLTGDTLYPGLLFVKDWATYRDSVHRLAQFAAARPVAHVLGAHVEMTATPRENYPYGTTYQPNEHVLQLDVAQLAELDGALVSLGPTPPNAPVAYDHFVIDPQ